MDITSSIFLHSTIIWKPRIVCQSFEEKKNASQKATKCHNVDCGCRPYAMILNFLNALNDCNENAKTINHIEWQWIVSFHRSLYYLLPYRITDDSVDTMSLDLEFILKDGIIQYYYVFVKFIRCIMLSVNGGRTNFKVPNFKIILELFGNRSQ